MTALNQPATLLFKPGGIGLIPVGHSSPPAFGLAVGCNDRLALTLQPAGPGERRRPHSDVSCGALAIDLAPTDSTLAPNAPAVGPQLGWPTRIEDDLVLGSLLGAGTFGTVHAARNKHTGEDYAVKVLRKGGPRTRVADTLARVAREADVLERLRCCPQVARLVGKYETARFVYFVLERSYGSNMMHLLKDRHRLCEAQLCSLVFECLQMLVACHAQRILHGDVKPHNFMMAQPLDDVPVCHLTREPVLKAVDFGTSRVLAPGEHMSQLIGSPAYTAPEVHLGHYELPADMWSLGMTAYQLVANKLPFWDSYRDLERSKWETLTSAVLMADIPMDYGPWLEVSPECRDFVMRLLERDPVTRLTAAQAVNHEWFAKLGCVSTSTASSVWSNNILPFVDAASEACVAAL